MNSDNDLTVPLTDIWKPLSLQLNSSKAIFGQFCFFDQPGNVN